MVDKLPNPTFSAGCKLSIAMTKDLEQVDVVLYGGQHGSQHAVSATQRCSELGIGDQIFFAGWRKLKLHCKPTPSQCLKLRCPSLPLLLLLTVRAKNPKSLFIDATHFASEPRHVSDAQVEETECQKKDTVRYKGGECDLAHWTEPLTTKAKRNSRGV
eukprot:SAG31_NODE_3732_length_3940_cov_35.007550_4_plen_158_part_00